MDLHLRVDPFYQATLSKIASASLHEIEPEIALFKQAMLGTQLRERSQTFFLFFSKAESKMFAVVAEKEFAIELAPLAGVTDPGYKFRNYMIEIRKVLVAQSAKAVRD